MLDVRVEILITGIAKQNHDTNRSLIQNMSRVRQLPSVKMLYKTLFANIMHTFTNGTVPTGTATAMNVTIDGHTFLLKKSALSVIVFILNDACNKMIYYLFV